MNSLTDLTMTDLTILFALLIVFQLKHLLADYPLQGWPWAHWMLGKFADDPRVWVPALLGHAAVHGVSTAAICFLFGRRELCWLGGVDMGVHFVMDRIKASRRMLGRWKPVC